MIICYLLVWKWFVAKKSGGYFGGQHHHPNSCKGSIAMQQKHEDRFWVTVAFLRFAESYRWVFSWSRQLLWNEPWIVIVGVQRAESEPSEVSVVCAWHSSSNFGPLRSSSCLHRLQPQHWIICAGSVQLRFTDWASWTSIFSQIVTTVTHVRQQFWLQ
jgi:hypothetical protein